MTRKKTQSNQEEREDRNQSRKKQKKKTENSENYHAKIDFLKKKKTKKPQQDYALPARLIRGKENTNCVKKEGSVLPPHGH